MASCSANRVDDAKTADPDPIAFRRNYLSGTMLVTLALRAEIALIAFGGPTVRDAATVDVANQTLFAS